MAGSVANHEPYIPGEGDAFPPVPQTYLADIYHSYTARGFGGEDGADLVVCAHPNGVTFLALAPDHPAASGTAAAALQAPAGQEARPSPGNAPFDDPTRARTARVSFKRKAGSLVDAPMRKGRGPWVQAGDPLCSLQTADGKRYTLRSPIKGALIEAHAKLETLVGGELLR